MPRLQVVEWEGRREGAEANEALQTTKGCWVTEEKVWGGE